MLKVTDIDAEGWVHWKVQLPAGVSLLAENVGNDGGGNLPAGSVRYNNSFFATGTMGVAGSDYDGPMPPAGTGTHRYVYSIEAQNGADAVFGTAEILGKYDAP